jgi:hypothetical protein
MRGDVYVREVLNKCEALKKARLWPAEPRMRPNAWLRNFSESDRPLAAFLLDNFTFYNDDLTDRLLMASYSSLGDGTPKGPTAPEKASLLASLNSAVFTRVDGEEPNPTDSGNLFCRKARQVLRIPDEHFRDPAQALDEVVAGKALVFVDDFVGSGDQFIGTWTRQYRDASPKSFAEAHQKKPFVAIYIALVATEFGLENIRIRAPNVAVTTAHIFDESVTVKGLTAHPSFEIPDVATAIETFLDVYTPRLRPPEFIAKSTSWLRYGYKDRGLLFAFEHSVPDATLPIFWSPGDKDWHPLLERR